MVVDVESSKLDSAPENPSNMREDRSERLAIPTSRRPKGDHYRTRKFKDLGDKRKVGEIHRLIGKGIGPVQGKMTFPATRFFIGPTYRNPISGMALRTRDNQRCLIHEGAFYPNLFLHKKGPFYPCLGDSF